MNEIGYALGSFCGGLFMGAICWKFGAWLGEAMFKNATATAFLGAVLSFWYATTRDDAPSTWGAWIAFVLLLVNHWSTKRTDEQ